MAKKKSDGPTDILASSVVSNPNAGGMHPAGTTPSMMPMGMPGNPMAGNPMQGNPMQGNPMAANVAITPFSLPEPLFLRTRSKNGVNS